MALRRSIIRQRLAAGSPIHCFKSNIPHSMIPELIGGAGMDCLWLDTEHFPSTTETMFSLVQACRLTDTDSVVRVPNGEFLLAAKMLDLGANAIMYPRCRDAAEVEELVRWTKFTPVGQRGGDTGVAAAGFGGESLADVMQHAADHTSLVVQIETPEALDNVDAIAAVPGIEILFLGPGDLSIALGVPCKPDQPELKDAMERIAAAAKKHGVAWGSASLGLGHAQQILDLGGQFVAFGSDSSLIRQQLGVIMESFKEMGVPFGG